MKKKSKSLTIKDLNKLEALEIADWVEDKKRREYKKSEKYKEGAKLAEKFNKKLSS